MIRVIFFDDFGSLQTNVILTRSCIPNNVDPFLVTKHTPTRYTT